MRVGVLGGGLQGCCVALALAESGVRVTIFDRNPTLLSRAAVANEGKIHLGYMYAGDPTLRTARMMMRGALAFGPFFRDHLGISLNCFRLSEPAVYVVHRRSQKSPDNVEGYLSSVHALVQQEADRARDDYFGIDLKAPIRRWRVSELESELDPEEAKAAFPSPEVAIDPVALAKLIRDRIAQTPAIEVLSDHQVIAVDAKDPPAVTMSSPNGVQRHCFDHVVNALWDGRLAIDSTAGHRPQRAWIHRLKYGVSFRPRPATRISRSITIVLGPFGEVVTYGNGSVYLTWYPSCLHDRTTNIQPPFWPTLPAEPDRSRILHGTFESLSKILPALASCRLDQLADVVVRGGPIVAWGKTDIDDPRSELHRRFEIGVTTVGRYHSIDPGKLTMAPYFARECAARIRPLSSIHASRSSPRSTSA